MSVDVFGRQWIREKEVYRGPAGIGFTVTTSGDFDIENKLLCNVAEAENDSDAVNLLQLKLWRDKLEEDIKKDIAESTVKIKQEIQGLREEIKKSVIEELSVDIEENKNNISFIECMIANGSENCTKKLNADE